MSYTLYATNVEWEKASNHLDGSGLENGVDMRGFHKQHARLVRNGLHGIAGLMKVAAAGGSCPAARLRAADDRYDGCARDAWQKAMRRRRPCCIEFGSAPATRRAASSVQRRSGARKRRSRKTSLLASGCAASFPRPGLRRTCGLKRAWHRRLHDLATRHLLLRWVRWRSFEGS